MARFTGGGSGSGSGAPGPRGPQGLPGVAGADGADGADALWNFTGAYNGGASYATGDIVTHEGQTWYRLNSNGGNVGDTPSEGTFWTLIAEKGTDGTGGSGAVVYLGDYVSGNGYIAGIAVVRGSDNNLYIATSNGGLGDPVGNTAEWDIFSDNSAGGGGFNWRGEWQENADPAYQEDDVVTYNGSTYKAGPASPYHSYNLHPETPSNGYAWLLMASKGAAGADGSPGADGADGTDGSIYNSYEGVWNSAYSYSLGDIVTYNGSTWISGSNDNSNSTPTSSGYPWAVLSSGGFNFRGEYDISGATSYTQNDVVTLWNTIFFLPTSSNAGQAPFSTWGILLEPWEILVPTAPNFRGAYDSEDAYYNGDVVSYNGAVYILAPKGGLPVGTNWNTPDDDASNNNWDVFVPAAEGFSWRGEWMSMPMPQYQINDVVSYSGNSYIAVSSDAATMTAPDQNEGWDLVASKGLGLTFRGEYDSMATYAPYNDIVSYEGTLYVSDNNNLIGGPFSGYAPVSAGMPSSYWEVFIPKPESFNWRGEWNSSPLDGSYQIGDVVGYQGSSYLRVTNIVPNSEPPFFGPGSPTPGPNIDWELMAAAGEGYNFRGEWLSYVPSYEAYVANDIVLYNGTAYIAAVRGGGTISAGSGTPGENTAGWEVFVPAAKGFIWKGEWQEPMPSMPYVEGDVVSYNSKIYVAQTPFMMSAEPGSGTPGGMGAGWVLMISSFNWRGAWSSTPNPLYVVSDLVSYNGSTWIAVPNSMNMGIMGTPGSSDSWQIFAAGLRNRGQWTSNPMDNLGAYTINDVVSYLGSSYVRTALPNPEETNPPASEEGYPYPNWALLASKGDTGSSANTGDITFDGIQIIGAGTASGDGYENGTMQLVPDGDLETDQYLIIDPTAPNHIHIRAGGEQDASNANLFLGAERTNVVVSDNGRSVGITTRPALIINTYLNTNPESDTNFVTGSTADIQIGYTVNVGGTDYIVDAIMAIDEGVISVTANGAVFNAGQNYTFRYEQPWDNSWSFNSDGVFTGPAMGGVKVPAIANSGDGNDLYVYATGANVNIQANDESVVLDGNTGEFLNDSSNPANQIAKIGDLSEESGIAFQSVRWTPNFEATGLVFSGTGSTHPAYNSYYVRQGQLVSFWITIDLATVTDFGTGQLKTALPFAPLAGTMNHFSGWVFVDETANPDLAGHIILNADHLANTTALDLHYIKQQGGANSPVMEAMLKQNTPVVLTTATNIYINGTYIAAPAV